MPGNQYIENIQVNQVNQEWLEDMPGLISIDESQPSFSAFDEANPFAALDINANPFGPLEANANPFGALEANANPFGPLEANANLEMTAEQWWATLPPGLYNVYQDMYSLFNTYTDPDGLMEDATTSLMEIALERHTDPDQPQEEWLGLFQDLTDMVSSNEAAMHRLYQFRFSFEEVLEWIPTLTNEEVNMIRPFIEWGSV
jgi:hypothetical protein